MDTIGNYANYDLEVKDGKLVITVDLDETHVRVEPSKSGKTLVIATTGGAVRPTGHPFFVNLTVYRKR